MDSKTSRLFNGIVYISLMFITALTIVTNPVNGWKLLLLSLLLVLSFSLRGDRPLARRLPKLLSKLSIVFDLALIYLIALSDMTRVSEIYFYLVIIDAVFHYAIRISPILAVMVYLEYVAIRFMRYIKWNFFDLDYFAPAIYENALYFLFVFIIVYVAKHQIAQGQVLTETMTELEERTEQYRKTNRMLQDTLIKVEELAALEERNRIAREIHDTVGHTLTTVLIELEAGKRLVPRNPQLALDKLELAQEQVRKGLDDIRHSVRMLREGSDILSLIPSLESLIRDTEAHVGVRIHRTCDSDLPVTSAQGRVLFRALQEGLTNGIRHGGCSEFHLSLHSHGDTILFRLKDNGTGCDGITQGFGLSSMRERVEGLGGVLHYKTAAGQGFCLEISIPIVKEAG